MRWGCQAGASVSSSRRRSHCAVGPWAPRTVGRFRASPVLSAAPILRWSWEDGWEVCGGSHTCGLPDYLLSLSVSLCSTFEGHKFIPFSFYVLKSWGGGASLVRTPRAEDHWQSENVHRSGLGLGTQQRKPSVRPAGSSVATQAWPHPSSFQNVLQLCCSVTLPAPCPAHAPVAWGWLGVGPMAW